MSLATRRILAAALLLIGSLGLCCGLFSGVLFPRLFDADVARVQALDPLSYAAFEDATPGRAALLEGRLSARNPASPEGFVIYTRSVAGLDRDGKRVWRELERVQPPLLLELPGGVARVVGDYNLNGSLERVGDDLTQIEGLRAGASVVAVGTLVQGQEGVELQADLVAAGTRAAFLASNRAAALFFSIFGWALIGGGALLFVGGLFVLLRLLRGRARRP